MHSCIFISNYHYCYAHVTQGHHAHILKKSQSTSAHVIPTFPIIPLNTFAARWQITILNVSLGNVGWDDCCDGQTCDCQEQQYMLNHILRTACAHLIASSTTCRWDSSYPVKSHLGDECWSFAFVALMGPLQIVSYRQKVFPWSSGAPNASKLWIPDADNINSAVSSSGGS